MFFVLVVWYKIHIISNYLIIFHRWGNTKTSTQTEILTHITVTISAHINTIWILFPYYSVAPLEGNDSFVSVSVLIIHASCTPSIHMVWSAADCTELPLMHYFYPPFPSLMGSLGHRNYNLVKKASFRCARVFNVMRIPEVLESL